MLERGNFHTLPRVMETDVTTMEIGMKFPETAKINLPYGPALLLLGVHREELKSTYHEDNFTLVFIA